MRRELAKFIRFAEVGPYFLFLLFLRSPFDLVYSMYHANLMKRTFDAIEANSEEQLISTFFMFFIAAILLFLYNGIIWMKFSKYIAKLYARVRVKLFRRIMGLSYPTVSEVPAGEWITHMNSDTEHAVDAFGESLNMPHGVVALVSVVFSAIILASLDVLMFLLAISFIFPYTIVSLVKLSRSLPELKEQSQQELARITSWLTPVIEAKEVVQLYGADDFLRENIKKSSLQLRKNQMKIYRKNAMKDSLLPMFGVSGYLAMLIFGGKQIRQGESSFGDLTKQIQYRGSLLKGSRCIITCFMNIRSNLAGVKRINKVLTIRK